MVDGKKVAVLFPGQGAFYGGVLSEVYAQYPQIGLTFREIDDVARQHLNVAVSDAIFWVDAQGVQDLLIKAPSVLQLAIYGVSIAIYRILHTLGLKPDVLMGHSLGEIAALVCAGAYTVPEGAEIICHRIQAIKTLGDMSGYMAALRTDPPMVAKLLALAGEDKCCIAVENSPTQTVISGTSESLNLASELAGVLRLPFVRLNAPYPFHCHLMEPAVAEFAARTRHLAQQPLQVPVYSPILGRYYRDDDPLTELLASHLVQRVRFSDAARTLRSEGVHYFVESGALNALSKLSESVLKKSEIAAIPTLDPKLGDSGSLKHAIQTLRDHHVLPMTPPVAPADLLPGVDQTAWSAFWDAYGERFLSEIQRQFEAFSQSAAAPARPAPGPNGGAPSGVSAPSPAAARPAAAPLYAAESRSGISRDALFQELAAMYAAALEYPEEVFTDAVELEAELGIDSVKQTELLTRVSERYKLPPLPPEFRLRDYHTMGQVVDFVHAALDGAAPAATTPAPVAQEEPRPAPASTVSPPAAGNGSAGPAMSREALFRELSALYAAALEYPEEVFTDAVELEAELGIDSVKQTELLTRVSDRYKLPPLPPEFRLRDYHTMGQVTDFVHGALAGTTPEPAPRPAPIIAEPVPAAAAGGAASPVISREALFGELAALYAAALEYPEEVFTDTVELEAELGIDSVKQTELLTRVSERYKLPPLPPEFRLRDYHTMGQVVDFVHAALSNMARLPGELLSEATPHTDGARELAHA